jgi:hypothetical protein
MYAILATTLPIPIPMSVGGWVRMADRREGERRQNWIPILSFAFSIIGSVGGSWVGSQTRTAVIETNVSSLKETVTSQGNETRSAIAGLTTLINSSNSRIGLLETANGARDRQIEGVMRIVDDMKVTMARADDDMRTDIKVQANILKNIQIGIARIEGELNSNRNKKEPGQ